MSVLSRLFPFLRDPSEKFIEEAQLVVEQVNEAAAELKDVDEAGLRRKTEELQERVAEGETTDDVMVEAFAVVKAMCALLVGQSWEIRGEEREWKEVPYDVQILGAVLLHRGQVIEMKTGEGKTLVSTMPVFLNALTGKGVHVVTVNDYLAQRDAEWVGQVHERLGLSVGINLHGMSKDEKREAYAADVTYGTNNEFGFDYLRDNMVMKREDRVQRGHAFAIIDEVDSILIDEARTPLIISAPAQGRVEMYERYARMVPKLKEGEHYNIDEKARSVSLTEEGLDKVEELLGMGNIYNAGGVAIVHHLEAALKAATLYHRDKQYVVKDDQVMIVDEFTGRLMEGRRFSEGLHQAIEAKEGVKIQRESRTLATITFQNYFRMYDKLAGMTGTAVTQAEEFGKVYGLETTPIPTHRPVAREDRGDVIYKNEKGKFLAIAREVKKRYDKGQPVLLGTASIERSEALSGLLQKEGVPHEVLNAKQHEREAKIVEHAGQKKAITIATNMAGRGTDIKLGEGVKELGGLFVLGTERHESRRIDNQLRGRSGRQGDPGESQFFVSLEDDLMRIFGGDRVKSMMTTLGVEDDVPIENRLISRSLENAQKKVESNNFDVRKHLLEYDDVMNKQREVLYGMRDGIMEAWEMEERGFEGEEVDWEGVERLQSRVQAMIEQEIEHVVGLHTSEDDLSNWNLEEISEVISSMFSAPDDLHQKLIARRDESSEGALQARDGMISWLIELAETAYDAKEKEIGERQMREVEKLVLLRSIDTLWIEHLDAMDRLREGVGLQGFGQRDPLTEYKKQGYELFQEFLASAGRTVATTIYKVGIVNQSSGQETAMEKESEMRTSGDGKDAPRQPEKKSETETIGRNDPCYCGSGKKYKKCHGQV